MIVRIRLPAEGQRDSVALTMRQVGQWIDRTARRRLRAWTRIVVAVMIGATGSCGRSTRGIVPTTDGGVRAARSPFCDRFATERVVRTDSIAIKLCAPEVPEDADCDFGGGITLHCRDFADVSPQLAEYYRTNRVPRLCSYRSRSGLVPCSEQPGQGCGSGSMCVHGLDTVGFGVCVPLPCNNE